MKNTIYEFKIIQDKFQQGETDIKENKASNVHKYEPIKPANK